MVKYYVKAWSTILQAVASAMMANDPYILAAMNGQDDGKLITTNGAASKEPAVFFFVVYGLVYEALASATDSSAVPAQHQRSVLGSLLALKSLVRPEYAGKAIMEPSIYDEFISVCYRLAMTETATVQIHLVDVLTVFATTQDSPSAAADTTTMSPTSPRAHCLRICSYLLKHSTSAARGPTIRK